MEVKYYKVTKGDKTLGVVLDVIQMQTVKEWQGDEAIEVIKDIEPDIEYFGEYYDGAGNVLNGQALFENIASCLYSLGAEDFEEIDQEQFQRLKGNI